MGTKIRIHRDGKLIGDITSKISLVAAKSQVDGKFKEVALGSGVVVDVIEVRTHASLRADGIVIHLYPGDLIQEVFE